VEIKAKVEEKVSSPEIVAKIFKTILDSESDMDKDKEHFWVMGLKSNNRVKFIELVSVGILNASLVHPREVFRPCIIRPVASIIIVHNHPSGDTAPSNEDKIITRRLVEVGLLLDLPIIDHLVLGDDGDYYSFKEESLINYPGK
jgi:DNA repair protein RadC